MGKIKKILENELVGGSNKTDIYPITSIKAVYDDNNNRLDNIIKLKGFVNITYSYGNKGVVEVLDLIDAVSLVPLSDRIPGFCGTFLSSNGWIICKFNGENLTTDWTNSDMWSLFGNSSEFAQELGDNPNVAISQKAVKDEVEKIDNKISSLLSINVSTKEELTQGISEAKLYTDKNIEDLIQYINNISNCGNLVECFERIVCIGDDLTAGVLPGNKVPNTGRESSRNWVSYFKKATGIDTINLGYNSTTTTNWRYSTPETINSNFNCALDLANIEGTQAYFIMLGLNDTIADGSIGDLDSDYNNNANSFYGNYDYIVRKLHSINPSAHIFVFTLIGSKLNSSYNTIIANIASLYPDYCHCIDFSNSLLFNTTFFQKVVVNDFLYPIGYNAFGNLIKYLVSEYIYKYPDKFIGVPHTSTSGSIDVQDLKLSSFNLPLPIGFYKTLYAEVLPNTASNKKVNWRISDGNSECIELIDTGSSTYCIIKGLVSGTVTVEASVENGAFKSSCTITVI